MPKSFESKEARTRWNWVVARNAMKLKAQLESGEILPEAVKDSLDFNVSVPENENRLTKDGAVHRKTYKLRYEEICYILQWCFSLILVFLQTYSCTMIEHFALWREYLLIFLFCKNFLPLSLKRQN